ncbi:ABC transporter ATP-binding protein [Telmatospirillum sp. J64-1]|uniref:ABC transporter ATP-binding protein n=1 Tax=Telmatospirillum sp. J64-1 TaxID=2502183 RepID=UPI00115E47B8|nr:ABC transporter ATP-binding protein [Telmatospirillum sp. J64-1]
MTTELQKDIRIAGLSVGYRSRQIIHDLTMPPLRKGTITALVGPNGAGKSTLLRALAGLLPAKGAIHYGEDDLVKMRMAERARLVAFMPQALPQSVALSVLEGVLSALKASPVAARIDSAQAAREMAVAVLNRLGIASLALEPLDRLSGGQRQMASMAQAIVREPEILLLDEPTSALDLRHQVDVMGMAREVADSGAIVIVVLHDLSLAARWADQVMILDRGRLVAAGAPEDAITPEVLARVYHVNARVERCSNGSVQVLVDGPLTEPVL